MRERAVFFNFIFFFFFFFFLRFSARATACVMSVASFSVKFFLKLHYFSLYLSLFVSRYHLRSAVKAVCLNSNSNSKWAIRCYRQRCALCRRFGIRMFTIMATSAFRFSILVCNIFPLFFYYFFWLQNRFYMSLLTEPKTSWQ